MKKVLCLVVSSVLLTSHATGAISVYTDRATWLAGVAGPVTTEDFNAIPLGTVYTSLTVLPSDLSVNPNGNIVDISDFAFGSIGEGNALRMFPDSPGVDIMFPGGGIYAFGFDYADVDLGGATLSFGSFTDALPLTGDADTGVTPDDFAFYGVIAGSPSEIPVITINYLSSEGFSIDNFSFAPVPEPTTLTLLTLGSLAWLIVRRRRLLHGSKPSSERI